MGGATQLGKYDVSQYGNAVGTHATANSYVAQHHFADGSAHFEPQTSYIDHYPQKVTISHASY